MKALYGKQFDNLYTINNENTKKLFQKFEQNIQYINNNKEQKIYFQNK